MYDLVLLDAFVVEIVVAILFVVVIVLFLFFSISICEARNDKT